MSKSWEQILGGYATDTLTEEEKRQLFEAALHDQALFDTLADEEALKALLADPQARQQILESLHASGISQETVASRPRRVRWFRRPSTLAWAGSLAAMGLALIFGWQMEKDWPPLIQQEQEVERSVSEKKVKDDKQEAFRALPAPLENREQVAALQSRDEIPFPSVAKLPSVPAVVPEADDDRADMAESVDHLRQVQGALEEYRRVPEEEGGPLSPFMEDQVVQDSKAFVDASQSQVEPQVQPSIMPEADEVGQSEAFKLAPARELAAAQVAKEEPLPPPGALDLFYAGIGADKQKTLESKLDSKNQTFAKVSNEVSMSEAKEENSLITQGNRVGGEALIQRAKGIRYSFLRTSAKKEEELADGQNITGDWRDVRLAIEPNEAGFLYVFAHVGMGKWQQIEGTTRLERRGNPEDGNVQAFQSVEFRLGVITNRFGQLVISSVVVLLSPTAIENVGKWLNGSVSLSELQIERTDDSVYVVRPNPTLDTPLRVDITLEE